MDPDWDDLKVFLAVARGESLSAAGKGLKRDPATVGRRIARLETALGAALFLRAPTGYALTEAGGRLMAHAEAVEQAVALGAEALRGEDTGRLSGQVRIGAPDGCANYLLPRVCAEIRARNPGLELQIVALPRVVNLSRREADFAIAVSPPAAGRLLVQKITDYRLHLVAHRDYLAAAAPIRDLADVVAHPVIGYIPDMIFDTELDYLAEIGADSVALASNAVSVQLGFLREAAGLGIAHDFSLPFVPGLQKVLPDSFALTRSYYLVRHAADARIGRLRRLGDLLAQGLRAEVARLEAIG
ncbi:LysR family transcriptional regulator [Maritimibacter sp. HL-12]|uniref:LysR family transcriptional regulator n=1 Tax=Maritimibacter sp. HL-12 TaxID=1162418 RepID=UPI000A0F22A9|nr:LysR family transcriptional regulator [Maritimibacter sp. HL-12]SMH58334.1 DNA-binding transcriptional regulator, LysR family [Maritimibacter sp. HL-12]